jgi:hypothetical protein
LVLSQRFAGFELDSEPRKLVTDFEGLIKALDGLAYKAVRNAAHKPGVE